MTQLLIHNFDRTRHPLPQGNPLRRLSERLTKFDDDLSLSSLDIGSAEPETIMRDTTLWSRKEEQDTLYLLVKGCAFTFSILPNGRRFIADVYRGGSICNWRGFAMNSLSTDIQVKAGAQLLRLPAEALRKACADRPALENALSLHENARAYRSLQRMRTLVVGRSEDKFLHFLLDLQDELTTPQGPKEQIDPIMTQIEISDMLGMSAVHLNRTIQSLLAAKAIERTTRTTYRIKDREREAENLNYRYFFSPDLNESSGKHSSVEQLR
ncbi:Crp/Fnr family transcriptional regulator [Parapontixanthobacter aurantiacus]|nr:Crp/Fnr family transcriptional regulator [Parapontixanthobacter aurantiacus]